jgi:hypothetical protein
MDIIKYYFLGIYLTTVISAWMFIDVEAVMNNPASIIEEIAIALMMGLMWPIVVPLAIGYKVVYLCRALFTAGN